MRRTFEFIIRNWPLKLAAIGLATVLYAGVVLSGNSRSWPGEVTIAVVDPPAGGVLLTPPGAVTEIRYRAPLDIAGQLTSQSFRATLDLSGLTPEQGGPPVEVPVQLVALDPRVQVVDYAPRAVDVRLDSVVGRMMPVTVERGVAPEGLVLGPPQIDPAAVLVRGASSRIAEVRSVVARLAVDASGLNIDQDVDLSAVDESGDLVPGVEVVPADARVRIDVARELAYAVLPVVADVTGEPAPGYRVGSVLVDPTTVTVSGEAPAVERLSAIVTAPVPVDGLMADRTRSVALELPAEISLIGDPEARVTVAIVPTRGSRTLEAGLQLIGARRDRTTTLSTGSIQVTLAGDVAALDALEAGRSGTLVGELDITGMGNGRHEVQVAIAPPDGLSVVSVAPRTVVVRITPLAATPSPPAGASTAPSATTVAASVPPSGSAAGRRVAPAPSPAASGGTLTPMPRLFGTDGIRGIANVDLKPPIAYALGRATAHRLLDGKGAILVGQDTRRSGDMLVAALTAGATSMGVDVHRMGVCPTPALAYATGALHYGAGIMVSASHNPAEDNGLKVLDGTGSKLDDEIEDELEALIWRSDELVGPTNALLGVAIDAPGPLDRYRQHRLGLARRTRSDLAVLVDGANGSGCHVAGEILSATGARVGVRFAEPDGVNINLACGATAPAALASLVAAEGADVGFALDGDADRCVAVDERGRVVDGDQLLGIIALDRLGRGRLDASTLVVSVLSNGGLADTVSQAGGEIVRTKVGDKFILDAMLYSGAGVGGEKSGHVIIREHTSSGDGIVTALEILDILSRSGRTLSELAARIPLYPQEQHTIPARHKDQWESDRQLVEAVRAAEAELAGRGRIVVRPSGTEPALRIMVEGPDAARVAALAGALARLASERLN